MQLGVVIKKPGGGSGGAGLKDSPSKNFYNSNVTHSKILSKKR